MLRTVILLTAFLVILVLAGIITKHSIVNQHDEKLDHLDKNEFSYSIGKHYTYKNSKLQRVIAMESEKEISVKIWSFNVLGNLSVRLFDTEGEVYLKKYGKNMDDSLTFTFKEGSYILGVDCNHAFLGGYVLGFRNIDDLYAPVKMDSVSQLQHIGNTGETPLNTDSVHFEQVVERGCGMGVDRENGPTVSESEI